MSRTGKVKSWASCLTYVHQMMCVCVCVFKINKYIFAHIYIPSRGRNSEAITVTDYGGHCQTF